MPTRYSYNLPISMQRKSRKVEFTRVDKQNQDVVKMEVLVRYQLCLNESPTKS